MNNRQVIRDIINRSMESLYHPTAEVLGRIVISYPPQEDLGDYATNAPLILAKELGKDPMAVAEEIKGSLSASTLIAEITVAKPGFLNFKLSTTTLQETVGEILKSKNKYGDIDQEKNRQKIQVEFVSANPTGPLHIGNFRGGPLGDSLARVLTKAGHGVQREYYHNDVGNQVQKLGESILWWVKKNNGEDPGEFPENGYQGSYVKELALSSRTLTQDSVTAGDLGKWAVDHFKDKALEICDKTIIKFEKVVAESEVRDGGWTKKALDVLANIKMLKKNAGATWFAPSDGFLEDRECVVIRSNGEYDYFSNDIGYNYNKFDRGFSKVINVWGANHHGHVARMKAAMQALDIDPDRLDVILYQWVTLLRNGEKLSMSKRAGTFVTAQEVLDEICSDALRFTFLTRDASTPLEFDVDLVKKQARENQVYYVQYAHARMSSILNKAGAVHELPAISKLVVPEELRLLKHLSRFPELIEDISQTYGVHRLTAYAVTLADLFHKFYEQCPVLSDRNKGLSSDVSAARVVLVKAAKIVLAETLNLLGVSAPEKM